MEIKILGAGCAKCKTLAQNTGEALKELGLEANLEKVEDIEQIVSFGVMSTPALVLNGFVILSGRTPDKEELKKLIKKHI